MLERLAALDVAIFTVVHQTLWGTPWLTVLEVVQTAGEGLGLTALFVFSMLLSPTGRRVELALRIFTPVGGAAAVTEVLKRIVNVERPKTLVRALVLNKAATLPAHYSWPSGHTTVVFAFATAVLLLRLFGSDIPPRRWTATTVFAFLVAVVTGLARVAVGAHFPGDVLGGALVGVTAAHLVVRILDAALRHRRLAEGIRTNARVQTPPNRLP